MKKVWLIVYRNPSESADPQVATCHSRGALIAELDRLNRGGYSVSGKPPDQMRIFELDPVEMVLTEVQEPTVTISPV